MDTQSLSSLLFLSTIAGLTACAQGATDEPGPIAFTTAPGGGDGSNDPWTDPFETTTDTPDDPTSAPDTSEGETGKVDDGFGTDETGGGDEGDEGTTGEPDDAPEDDTAASGPGGSTSGGDDGGGDDGGVAETSGGAVNPADPCPGVAQLYADCIPEYTYEGELAFCEGTVADAEAVSNACAVAHQDFLACLSGVDCLTLLLPFIPQCALQEAARDNACA
ncbi:MAG: hypothetical protein AAGA54_35195 [Myxococcota bacterium]